MVGVGGGDGGPPRWSNGTEPAPITPGVVLTIVVLFVLVVGFIYFF